MTRSLKLAAVHTQAALCHPEAVDPLLFRMAAFQSSSARYCQAHRNLERVERTVRHCRHLAGDTSPLRRVVLLGHDQVDLAMKETEAILDGDLERARRLRYRFWLAEDEHLHLLTLLADELAELVG